MLAFGDRRQLIFQIATRTPNVPNAMIEASASRNLIRHSRISSLQHLDVISATPFFTLIFEAIRGPGAVEGGAGL